MNIRIVEVFGEIKHDGEKAILFHDGTINVWLPKSQISYEAPNKYKQTTVQMPEWLAIGKELI